MGRKIPMWQAVLVMLFLVAVLMYCLGVLGKATGIDALKCSYGEAHIGHVGLLLGVPLQHLVHVHLVDVVGREDADPVRPEQGNEIC